MKLISMVNFVLQENEIKSEDFSISEDVNKIAMTKAIRVFSYANFLNQPLTLGMFVPCDEKGNVLTEPTEGLEDDGNWNYQARCNEYQQAKENVLFEYYGEWVADNIIDVYPDIESLTTIGGFTLTKSAIKQIGL